MNICTREVIKKKEVEYMPEEMREEEKVPVGYLVEWSGVGGRERVCGVRWFLLPTYCYEETQRGKEEEANYSIKTSRRKRYEVKS